MTEKLKQIIREEMINLPKESQEAINSFGWERVSEEIAKKYLLGEEEINKLQAQIAIVMVGAGEQNFLALNIEDEIGISKDEAEKMAGEVVQQIFKPIINKLTEIIKKDLKNKSIHWQQNLDFILSGGDYTAFIRRVENQNQDVSNLKKEFNPSKLDDLKSRFTI